MAQCELFEFYDNKEIKMICWYECGECNYVWNELDSIGQCPKCQCHTNFSSWLGAKDNSDLFNQKGADRVCMNPMEFEKKYNQPKW